MAENDTKKPSIQKKREQSAQIERMLGDITPLRSSFESLAKMANQVVVEYRKLLMNSGLKEMIEQNAAFGKIEIPHKAFQTASLDLDRIHRSWKATVISDIASSYKASEIVASLDLTNATAISSLAALDIATATIHASQTQKILKGLNVGMSESLAETTKADFNALKTASISLAASYQQITSNMTRLDSLFSSPHFIMPATSREMFASNHVLKVITTPEPFDVAEEQEHLDDAQREIVDCASLVEQFAPDLLDTLSGAREALQSGNPDHIRHTLISLRSLVENLTWRLAPDEQVLRWIPDDKKIEYVHNNRPTRVARFAFICREFSGGSLEVFLDKDAQAYSKLFDILGRVHQLSPDLNEIELKALMFRVESFVHFLLRIHFE